MNKFYYVYVLKSDVDNKFYTGLTNNLMRRLSEHNTRKNLSTKNRAPFKLIYWEGCLNQKDATEREKYLKSTWGKRYLRNRMKNYLSA